jgi:hypothetical protein
MPPTYSQILLKQTTVLGQEYTPPVTQGVPCPSAAIVFNVTNVGGGVAAYLEGLEPASGSWYTAARLPDILTNGVTAVQVGPGLAVDILMPQTWRVMLASTGSATVSVSSTLYP